MENPQTWGRAEQIVEEAIEKFEDDIADGIFGYSQVRHITDALREAGLLRSEPEQPPTEGEI